MKILIAINNRVLCEALGEAIAKSWIGEVYGCDPVLPSPFSPDLVLFDSLDTVSRLQPLHPEAKFVLLDNGLSEQEINFLLLRHRICGIIAPATGLELFVKALCCIGDGEIWIEQKQLKSLLQPKPGKPLPENLRQFSLQDQKIIELVGQGRTNREIARELCLSEATVKAHLGRIFKLIGVKHRAQLACIASRSSPSFS